MRSVFLLIPIVMYLVVSMKSHYQLGIRHLLPILPLMYIFAALQFARLKCLTPLISLLILLATIETAAIHPDYLAFFNFACGGPTHGDRYLIDSNLDWGQDVYRLANWLHSDEACGRDYTIRCAYTNDQMLKEFDLNPAAKPQNRTDFSRSARISSVVFRKAAVIRSRFSRPRIIPGFGGILW